MAEKKEKGENKNTVYQAVFPLQKGRGKREKVKV